MMRRIAHEKIQVIAAYDGARTDLNRLASHNHTKLFADILHDKARIQRIIAETSEKYDGALVGKAEKDFYYVVARSLTATRNDLGQKPIPNGNGDCFIYTELIKPHNITAQPHYKTFIGKGIFTNHESNRVERCFGTQLDVRFAYGPAPILQADTSLHNLLAIDKSKAADIGVLDGIINGYLNTWSMGCDIEAAVCSICGHTVVADTDRRCDHVQAGNKGREMIADAGIPFSWAGKRVKAADLLIGPSFVELSNVTVPADHTAETMEVIGEVGSLQKAANYETPAYTTVDPSKSTTKKVFVVPDNQGAYIVKIQEESEAKFGDMQTALDFVDSLQRTASYDDPHNFEYGADTAEEEAQNSDTESPRMAKKTLFENHLHGKRNTSSVREVANFLIGAGK